MKTLKLPITNGTFSASDVTVSGTNDSTTHNVYVAFTQADSGYVAIQYKVSGSNNWQPMGKVDLTDTEVATFKVSGVITDWRFVVAGASGTGSIEVTDSEKLEDIHPLSLYGETGGMSPEEIGKAISKSTLHITDYETQRILSWDDQLSDSYYVFRNGELVSTTSEKTYTDTMAPDGQLVTYSVVGVASSVVVYRSGDVKTSSAPYFSTVKNLVAFWDFSNTSDLSTAYGVSSFTLTSVGGTPTRTNDASAPFGGYITLDGSTYLNLPGEDVGALNLGATTGKCTVIGWVRRNSTNNGFIAGCWRENNGDPQRSYGLFVDLPVYGGADRVCGHVSRYGGASEGYPFSIDYSSSLQTVSPHKYGEWDMVAFTYDGSFARSYMNATFDEYLDFTDNQGKTYNKNPYAFGLGLNPDSGVDFTVGAVELTGGMGNFLIGDLAGVAVFNAALSHNEIREVYRATITNSKSSVSLAAITNNTGVSELGLKSYYDTTATDTSDTPSVNNWQASIAGGLPYVSITENDPTKISVLVYEDMSVSGAKVVSAIINNASTSDTLRLCVQVNGRWYATSEQFTADVPGVGTDWSTEKEISARIYDSLFLEATIDPGVELSLGQTTPVPDGVITGVGIFSDGPTNTIRARRIKVF